MTHHLDGRGVAEVIAGLAAFSLCVARHMPAPFDDSVYYAWLFDSVQDQFKNNDRIGLRRKRNVPVVSDHTQETA